MMNICRKTSSIVSFLFKGNLKWNPLLFAKSHLCFYFPLYIQEAKPIRHLFTNESLGITTYLEDRNQGQVNTSNSNNFKENFNTKIQNLPLKLLTDNFRRFIYLIENTPEDLNLLRKALKQLDAQSTGKLKNQFNEREYLFGPVVMRALSYFEQPEVAIEV